MVSVGYCNRWLGWILLVVGFAMALLDPWSLGERSSAGLVDGPALIPRHAQAILLGLAFLQLNFADILGGAALPPDNMWGVLPTRDLISGQRRAIAGWLALIGGLASVAGWGLVMVDPHLAWLAVGGAVLHGLAFAVLVGSLESDEWLALRVLLALLCAVMILDAVLALFAAGPGWVSPNVTGPEDGPRLRLLHLARIAVLALSLALLLLLGLFLVEEFAT